MLQSFPKMTQSIKKGVTRISSITSALRSFGREDHTQRSMIDISEVVESAMVITKNEYKYHAEIELKMADDIPQIYGSFLQIEQVFINMIVNSSYAIKEKAEKLSSKNIPFEGRISIQILKSETKKDHIEIIFKDNGTGIPENIINRIFDPFYTTKAREKGTGLGMSIAYGIINDHKGSISVKSIVGQETTFYISLPVKHEIPEKPGNNN